MKNAEEMVNFGQGNIEAVMKSGQILTTGMQELGKQVAANAQASWEEAFSTVRAMASARSMKDAMEMQATLARSVFEIAFRQTHQVAETSFKVSEQAMAPITSRVSLAVGALGRNA